MHIGMGGSVSWSQTGDHRSGLRAATPTYGTDIAASGNLTMPFTF